MECEGSFTVCAVVIYSVCVAVDVTNSDASHQSRPLNIIDISALPLKLLMIHEVADDSQ